MAVLDLQPDCYFPGPHLNHSKFSYIRMVCVESKWALPDLALLAVILHTHSWLSSPRVSTPATESIPLVIIGVGKHSFSIAQHAATTCIMCYFDRLVGKDRFLTRALKNVITCTEMIHDGVDIRLLGVDIRLLGHHAEPLLHTQH